MRLFEDSDFPPVDGYFLHKGGHSRPRDVMLLRECDLFPRRAGSCSMPVVAVDLDDVGTWREKIGVVVEEWMWWMAIESQPQISSEWL
jgi:hypothetical protein